tara:strand:- start:481 stop:912 length:432 start_codon:yes stop_codon:yes gene_type:complete
MTTITIYTDGACSGNPGPGGWGATLSDGKKEKEIYGGEPETTNNRMELMAAIMALEALKQPLNVILYTDSKYVQKGISEWLPGWKARGWRNSQGKPVKNVDLWQRLEAAEADHQVNWRWVKGHSGDAGNERADELANEGMYSL